MSYEIVKSIKVADNKVMIKGSSNNVSPKTYNWWECYPLTKTLKEKGEKELDIEILKAYEEGNFQQGNKNKYTRAMEILLHDPEYEKISWRYNWDESKKPENKEKLRKLLEKSLKAKLPKEKWIIVKKNPLSLEKENVYFYHKKNSSYCKWYEKKEKAKLFNFKEDAEMSKKYFANSDNWEIIPY